MPMTITLDSRLVGHVLVVTPRRTVSSLAGDDLQAELSAILDRIAQPDVQAIVLDFGQTEYFSSMMLESLRRFDTKARAADVRMALCNVPAVGRETLRITHFDTLWPIFDSLEEAIRSTES